MRCGWARTGRAGFRLTAGRAARACGRRSARGAVLISEPLAWRLRLSARRARSPSPRAGGPRAFPIAGVYREYGNDRGEGLHRAAAPTGACWRDEAIGGLGLYLEPRVSAAAHSRRLRAAARGRQALLHPLQRGSARAVDAHLRAHLRHHAGAVLARRGRGGDRAGERAARLAARARARAGAAAHPGRDARGQRRAGDRADALHGRAAVLAAAARRTPHRARADRGHQPPRLRLADRSASGCPRSSPTRSSLALARRARRRPCIRRGAAPRAPLAAGLREE